MKSLECLDELLIVLETKSNDAEPVKFSDKILKVAGKIKVFEKTGPVQHVKNDLREKIKLNFVIYHSLRMLLIVDKLENCLDGKDWIRFKQLIKAVDENVARGELIDEGEILFVC